MAEKETIPRRFGPYLLTAVLGEDALGRVYRAIRIEGERGFVRLRVLESPEISEDAVLDAIQEYGEIHAFLKNAAITRGVQMDSAGGTPFIAWNQESGRTLDALLARAREQHQPVPAEHALSIAEKIATALDHAYNTIVDGERTLHGLVWPGFVSVSDDGATRLTGFGLAPAFASSLGKPLFSGQVEPYLAPERRTEARIGKNSDVFSVGVILFELLTGALPSREDPLGDVHAAAREEDSPLVPEIVSILRMSLGPAETRYQSSGELRRELGRLLFRGPFAPSTFNLAFFLNSLFGAEIEAETKARLEEASLDLGASPKTPLTSSPRPQPVLRTPPARPLPPPAPPEKRAAPPRRASVAFIIAGLLIAAVVGGVYAISRAPERPAPKAASPQAPTPLPVAAFAPTAAPATDLPDAEFQDEVSRRVAEELRRLEEGLAAERRATEAAAAAKVRLETQEAEPVRAPQAAPQPPPSAPEAAPPLSEPTRVAAASPAPPPVREEAVPSSSTEITPPRIKKVIKPLYPPFALRQKIGGIVILRVLVSEVGRPLDVQVLRGARAGLSEAAASAVRRWTFEPAVRDGVAVEAWTTIPIPFEP